MLLVSRETHVETVIDMTITLEKLSEIAGVNVKDPDGILDEYKNATFSSIEKTSDKHLNGIHSIKVSLKLEKHMHSFVNCTFGGETVTFIISDEYGEMEIVELD